MSEESPLPLADAVISQELAALEQPEVDHIRRAMALAALSAIPWVGAVAAAMASVKTASDQSKVDALQRQWLEAHARKIQELEGTLEGMASRLETLGDEVKARLQSEEYLALLRSGFRKWDQAESAEKKGLIVKLLTNAGAATLTSDEVVQLFLDWMDSYHEIHFRVIRAIYKQPGITRRGIWASMHPKIPREDSAEADLFKKLMRDLNLGQVIRQHREKNYDGSFRPKTKSKPVPGGKGFTSAFDDEEEYELTALGTQFVHYAMDDLVPRIGGNSSPA